METEKIAKQQLKWTKLLTAAVLALLCLALVLTVSLLRTARTVREVGQELQVVAARMEKLTAQLDVQDLNECVEALETTAEKLNAVDWERLGSSANETLEQTRVSLKAMSDAMDKMDFEALNVAIANLQTVIEPLARFTSRFS